MIFQNAKFVLAAAVLCVPLSGFAEEGQAPQPQAATPTDQAQPQAANPPTQAQPAAPSGKVKVASTGESMNPWTDCGIGAMIFDETKWAAVTSNVIWDAGITATTSAVSSKHVCEGKKVAAAFFINTTYASLEEETVNGSASHTTAMLNMLGCDSAAHPAIAESIRTQFGAYVAEDSYAEKSQSEKAQGYYFIVDGVTSGQFAQQCQMI